MLRWAKAIYNMAYQPAYKEYEDSYSYHANKLYRVWFSNNPDVFLGLENELRMIRMREKNKNAIISLIYSSRSLNQAAKEKLHQFCQRYRITAVDFDTELEKWLQDPADKKLYQIAKSEFDHVLDKAGGNLAAPSDCIRQMLAVIERYGYYSDFDVDVIFDNLPSPEFTTESPILFNGDYFINENNATVFNPNSDFLAYAYDPQNPEQLHPDAIESIRQVQQCIIANYNNAFRLEILYPNPGELSSDEAILMGFLFREFMKKYGDQPSVFNFRLFIESIKDKNQTKTVELYRFINQLVGICVSGPGNYNAMFAGCKPSYCEKFPRLIKERDLPEWGAYFSIFDKSSFIKNPQLTLCIVSNNCMAKAKALIDAGRQEEVRDDSWSEEGIVFKKQRELKMRTAATRIFQIWRTGFAMHKQLYVNLKPIASAEVIKSIRNGQYSLALRQASCQSNLQVIKLLVKFKDDINLDINGTTSKNQTAFDLASDKTIRNYLEENGAKSGHTIARSHKK